MCTFICTNYQSRINTNLIIHIYESLGFGLKSKSIVICWLVPAYSRRLTYQFSSKKQEPTVELKSSFSSKRYLLTAIHGIVLA